MNIQKPHWTTCRNFNVRSVEVNGSVYAILGVPTGSGLTYRRVPYLNGNRVETAQTGEGDTVFLLTDNQGKHHVFGSVEEYLQFREKRLEE